MNVSSGGCLGKNQALSRRLSRKLASIRQVLSARDFAHAFVDSAPRNPQGMCGGRDVSIQALERVVNALYFELAQR